MRLERIEKVCLEFLRNSANPLVPVQVLHETCLAEGEAGLDCEALAKFLSEHAEIMVIDGSSEELPLPEEAFRQAGVHLGSRAILKSRLPSRQEIQEMFQQQVEHMRANLLEAIRKATALGDGAAVKDLESALERSYELEKKVKTHFSQNRG